MKLLRRIIIFLLVFYLTYMFLTKITHGDVLSNESAMMIPQTSAIDQSSENYMGTEEEDQLFSEPDMLFRKLEQKKLPPLSEKEKITWSFRLAETNPFL